MEIMNDIKYVILVILPRWWIGMEIFKVTLA